MDKMISLRSSENLETQKWTWKLWLELRPKIVSYSQNWQWHKIEEMIHMKEQKEYV